MIKHNTSLIFFRRWPAKGVNVKEGFIPIVWSDVAATVEDFNGKCKWTLEGLFWPDVPDGWRKKRPCQLPTHNFPLLCQIIWSCSVDLAPSQRFPSETVQDCLCTLWKPEERHILFIKLILLEGFKSLSSMLFASRATSWRHYAYVVFKFILEFIFNPPNPPLIWFSLYSNGKSVLRRAVVALENWLYMAHMSHFGWPVCYLH